MQTPLFARQPIFNNDLEVIAYELLFRNSDTNAAGVFDGDQASSHVLLYAFGEHRIEDIIGGTEAFINFTQNLISVRPPLPPHQLVIEVLEDVKPTREVMESLKSLKQHGYRIALDDFFISKDTRELLKVADIIKIDVLALSKAELQKYVEMLRPLNVKLLAEKVETHEMMQDCIDLGFDAFQGYFLSKPQIIKGVKASQNKQTILRIVSELTAPDIDFDKLVDTISTDPKITYKILKLVNSSAVSTANSITSLKQAVSLLGINHIRNWTTFLLLASDESKPAALSDIGTQRAKFCELLASKIQNTAFGESCFTVGLLSTFDALLDLPLGTVIENLSLSDDIENALVDQTGITGQVLQTVLAYEKGDWSALDWDFLTTHGINDLILSQIYTEALAWSAMMVKNGR